MIRTIHDASSAANGARHDKTVGMLSLLGVAMETALAATLLLRGLTLAAHAAGSVACQA